MSDKFVTPDGEPLRCSECGEVITLSNVGVIEKKPGSQELKRHKCGNCHVSDRERERRRRKKIREKRGLKFQA